jgi:hypothetical protein
MKRLTLTFTLLALSALLPARVRAQQVDCYTTFPIWGEAWVVKLNPAQAAAEATARAKIHLYTQAAVFNCPEQCPVLLEVGPMIEFLPDLTLLPDGRTLAHAQVENPYQCIQ